MAAGTGIHNGRVFILYFCDGGADAMVCRGDFVVRKLLIDLGNDTLQCFESYDLSRTGDTTPTKNTRNTF